MLTRLSVHWADRMVATRQLERRREVELAVGVGVQVAELAVDRCGRAEPDRQASRTPTGPPSA